MADERAAADQRSRHVKELEPLAYLLLGGNGGGAEVRLGQ